MHPRSVLLAPTWQSRVLLHSRSPGRTAPARLLCQFIGRERDSSLDTPADGAKALLLSVSSALMLAGGALATPEVMQEAPAPFEQQAELEGSSSAPASLPPFDLAMLAIVNTADSLSAATGEFLELTAGTASSLAAAPLPGAAAGEGQGPLGYAASGAVVAAAFGAADLPCAPSLPACDLPAAQQQPPPAGAVGAVAHRMSRQALTVADEALQLAALLEREGQAADPAYTTLLRQIQDAAMAVSAMAAEIAEPLLVVDEAADEGDVSH